MSAIVLTTDERLAQASWDVPLQGTVTDKAWYFAG